MTHPAGDHATEGIRLAKRVAELKGCSRREAEQYIEGGYVRVDGQVVETPQFRVQAQTVELDPHATLLPQPSVTLLLHKPPGVDTDTAVRLLTPQHRSKTDTSGIYPLQRHVQALHCTPPLETGASGLLIFTQDWRVQRKLTEDAGVIEHEVMVEVQGSVAPEALKRLNRDGAKVSPSSQKGSTTGLRFAIKGARPGQIAHLCDGAGLQIVAMKRIRVGRVALTGLDVGTWRYLGSAERV